MKLIPGSVRVRLTLWYVGIMSLVLVLFALGVYGYIRESLFSQIERQLKDNLAVLEAGVKADLAEISEVERHTRVLAFRIMEGDFTLYASGGWLTGDLDKAGTPPTQGRWIFQSSRGGIYHIAERQVTVGKRSLNVATAEQSRQVHESLTRLKYTLAAALPLALLVSFAGGYFLAGRALRPVQLITRRAQDISADNLSERLVVANADDELGQLSSVLNDAFTRLETSFENLQRFTHDAAHELRTPLTVIRSVGEVGLQEQRDSESYREVIGSMLEEVDRMIQLVDGLLTLARAESGRFMAERKRVNLADLCRKTVDCLQVLAEEKHQTLTLDIVGEPYATIDSETFRLALINLLANAIRFTPEGGSIWVRVHDHDGRKPVFEVEDTGPGIAPEHQSQIFERFYRVDASRAQHSGGTGLGLAITRWAVESNGGTIALVTTPGHGALFRIEFQ